jgi:hypothetical protein
MVQGIGSVIGPRCGSGWLPREAIIARLAALLLPVLNRAKRVLLVVGLAAFYSGRSLADSLAPFTFVMIDSQTEQLYGSLPFNRALIARAVERLTAEKVKGVIIKFFYDLPSNEEDDRLLEGSICAVPVALQASLNDAEGTTNSLEPRFRFGALALPHLLPLFSGEKALIPLERFRRCAKAVGFVDSSESEIPLVESYQGTLVKSLYLVALEMASNQKAEVSPSGLVTLGKARLGVMHPIAFPATNSLSYIPLHEILSQKGATWQAKVKGSVVVLGYDGKNIHTIKTPSGAVGAHRFFIFVLLSLADGFEKAQRELNGR